LCEERVTSNRRYAIRSLVTANSFAVTQFCFAYTQGTDPTLDAYSAFSNYASPSSTTSVPKPSESHLSTLLQEHNITTLYVLGLATDYCVRATALDALSVSGMEKVYVVWEGVRAVGGADATERVKREMEERGVRGVSVGEAKERGLVG
jgi:nicotinamidase/pyrazinamidase